MKTIVCTLFGLAMALSIYAQNYLPDEFIVQYVEGVTNAEKQAVRDLYAITDYSEIDEVTDHWFDIQFPINVTQDGITETVLSIEELLLNINIQDGTTSTESDPRADVNEQDLNYILTLEDNGALYANGTFDPLPFCNDNQNGRLIGPALASDGSEQEYIPHIIIIDQLMNVPDLNVNTILEFPILFKGDESIDPNDYGGDHANKVYSIIKNQLDQAGISASYTNLAVFDATGSASYSRLLQSLGAISANAIVNFSANMVIDIAANDDDLILFDTWNDKLMKTKSLLISSAGNQDLNNVENIYPAAGNWDHEISVAGTQSCFTEALSFSNADPAYIDIAVEGTDVLAYGENGYELVSGTSYSSAFVTGAAAQLAARCSFFRPLLIKAKILDSSHKNPDLNSLCKNGRTLWVTRSIENLDLQTCLPPSSNGNRSYSTQDDIKGDSYQINTSPNPFSDKGLVRIPLLESADVRLVLYNLVGQAVSTVYKATGEKGEVIQWETPDNLMPGIYMLHVQVGEEQYQQTLIKQ